MHSLVTIYNVILMHVLQLAGGQLILIYIIIGILLLSSLSDMHGGASGMLFGCVYNIGVYPLL